MKVETARARASQAWSEGQDQTLLDIVHSYRGKTIHPLEVARENFERVHPQQIVRSG